MKPKLQTLDNEASDILLQYMKSNKIDVQLAPPHMHRRNLAERAIRTWKDNCVFISRFQHVATKIVQFSPECK